MNLLDNLTTAVSALSLTIKQGAMPDKPDDCVCMILSNGESSVKYFGMPTVIAYPKIKVLVRASTYETSRTTIIAMREIFKTYRDSAVLGCIVIGDIEDLGDDDNNRRTFVLELKLITEE